MLTVPEASCRTRTSKKTGPDVGRILGSEILAVNLVVSGAELALVLPSKDGRSMVDVPCVGAAPRQNLKHPDRAFNHSAAGARGPAP